jgi:hypothetical protein
MNRFVSRASARWLGRILLLLVILCGLELLMRSQVHKVSKDFELYGTYSARAERLVDHPAYRVALVGNSALLHGVDVGGLRSELEAALGRPAAVDKFYATGSHLNTWYYMLEHYFWRPGHVPDLIVVLYFDDSLVDGKALEVGRLAWCFTDREDWSDVMKTELPTVSSRVDFVLSSHSVIWANRDRIKTRVLGLLSPGYVKYESRVNEINYAHQRHAPSANAPPPASHVVLQRLLDRARGCNSRVCFVAFPTLVPGRPDGYDLYPEQTRMMAESGARLVDLRRTPELMPEMYDTRTHLNAAGRELFTRRLARALSGTTGPGSAGEETAPAKGSFAEVGAGVQTASPLVR